MPSTLEDDLGFLLARTHRAVKRSPVSLPEPAAIACEQLRVLNALCEGVDLRHADLADRVNAGRRSAARMPGRTESAGLIGRTADAAGSRANCITLADEGRYLLEQAAPQRYQGPGQEQVAELEGWLGRVEESARGTMPHRCRGGDTVDETEREGQGHRLDAATRAPRADSASDVRRGLAQGTDGRVYADGRLVHCSRPPPGAGAPSRSWRAPAPLIARGG